MNTLDDHWKTEFPPANRFMVSFKSRHLTTTGTWCTQSQRRFFLADNRKDAEQAALIELNDQKYWPKGFHEWSNLNAYNVPEMAAIAFGGMRFKKDIRKQTVKMP